MKLGDILSLALFSGSLSLAFSSSLQALEGNEILGHWQERCQKVFPSAADAGFQFMQSADGTNFSIGRIAMYFNANHCKSGGIPDVIADAEATDFFLPRETSKLIWQAKASRYTMTPMTKAGLAYVLVATRSLNAKIGEPKEFLPAGEIYEWFSSIKLEHGVLHVSVPVGGTSIDHPASGYELRLLKQ